MSKLRTICTFAGLIAFGYFLRDGVNLVTWNSTGKVKLCSIPTPVYETEIVIFTDSFQEVAQALYYEIHTGAVVSVPMTFFDVTDIDKGVTTSSFKVIGGENSDLVGMSYASDPESILVMQDFFSDESWPRAGYSEDHDSTRERGEDLLRRLQSESKNPDLRLSDG